MHLKTSARIDLKSLSDKETGTLKCERLAHATYSQVATATYLQVATATNTDFGLNWDLCAEGASAAEEGPRAAWGTNMRLLH